VEALFSLGSACETSNIATTIKIAPKLEITVKAPPRKIVEIETATTISVKRTTEEVTGEICFSPLSHK